MVTALGRVVLEQPRESFWPEGTPSICVRPRGSCVREETPRACVCSNGSCGPKGTPRTCFWPGRWQGTRTLHGTESTPYWSPRLPLVEGKLSAALVAPVSELTAYLAPTKSVRPDNFVLRAISVLSANSTLPANLVLSARPLIKPNSTPPDMPPWAVTASPASRGHGASARPPETKIKQRY